MVPSARRTVPRWRRYSPHPPGWFPVRLGQRERQGLLLAPQGWSRHVRLLTGLHALPPSPHPWGGPETEVNAIASAIAASTCWSGLGSVVKVDLGPG
ncbi:hypothetical protein GCM10010510_72180 [Streptomyces anandii JCM 4720]|nr:hypothetical protein GCM10010510_72180 [Streptomyces anandii JCM 4720]